MWRTTTVLVRNWWGDILDIPDQFSPPASIVTLDRNYRSTQTNLAAANGVIDLAKERYKEERAVPKRRRPSRASTPAPAKRTE